MGWYARVPEALFALERLPWRNCPANLSECDRFRAQRHEVLPHFRRVDVHEVELEHHIELLALRKNVIRERQGRVGIWCFANSDQVVSWKVYCITLDTCNQRAV